MEQFSCSASETTEFIPFQQIFGDVFHNGWLLDGVHLDEIPNHKLASFIGTLPGRVVGMPDPLPAEVTSFTTWAAMQPKPRSVSGGGAPKSSPTTSQAPQNVTGGGGNNQAGATAPVSNAVTAGAAPGAPASAAGKKSTGVQQQEEGELADYESENESMDQTEKEGGVGGDMENMDIEEQMRSFDKACEESNGPR